MNQCEQRFPSFDDYAFAADEMLRDKCAGQGRIASDARHAAYGGGSNAVIDG